MTWKPWHPRTVLNQSGRCRRCRRLLDFQPYRFEERRIAGPNAVETVSYFCEAFRPNHHGLIKLYNVAGTRINSPQE